MKKNIDVPKDLRTFSRNAVLKRLIPCALLLIGLVTVWLLFGDVIFNVGDNLSWNIFGWAVVLILPFFVTGFPIKIVEPTWYGKIIDVVVSEGSEFSKEHAPRVVKYDAVYVDITIEKHNGRKIVRTILASQFSARPRKGAIRSVDNLEYYLKLYPKGATVFHLRGTKNVIVLNTEFGHQCAVCGSVNDASLEKCRICKHTLVKSADIITVEKS